MQETLLAKKRRGPEPTGKGTQVVVRMQPELLSAVDRLIAEQPEPKPSRPEVDRRIVDVGVEHFLPASLGGSGRENLLFACACCNNDVSGRDDDLTTAIDLWRRTQDDPPSRPEAIRYILRNWLTGHGLLAHREDADEAN